jgi:hypothetical protein
LAIELKLKDKVHLVTEEFGEQITECVWRFEDECGDEYHTCIDGSCSVVDEMDRPLFAYTHTTTVGRSPVTAFADSPRWLSRLEELFVQAKQIRKARSAQRRLEWAEQRRREFGLSPKEV